MPTVLVVDDSPVDRRLVGGLLEAESDWTVEYAAEGAEALSRAKDSVPDVVVTDLRMPNMDGLELVKAMRIQHPNVPVILMTAYGSEALAVEALRKGAASYVPKSQLAEMLVSTVEEVLARSRGDPACERLMRHLDKPEFAFFVELENDVALIDPLVNLVQQTAAREGLCDSTGRLQIGVALREALLNALFHGNLQIGREQMRAVREKLLEEKDFSLAKEHQSQSPFQDRRIYVDVKISKDEARIVVRDEGSGFDVAALPTPSDSVAQQQTTGRGVALMRTFMDEVTYNDIGNEVTMVRRRHD